MASEPTQPAGHIPDFVAAAVALMRAQLGSELTVADLADHVGYSRFHFSRLFTGVTGLAPMEYCAALRFAEAKRLLLTTDEPVVDVCAEVGFTSLSTFSRRFRHAVGTAPAGLRRLADDVAEHPVSPFSVSERGQPSITVWLDLGGGLGLGHKDEDVPVSSVLSESPPSAVHDALRQPRQTWIGWYPRPVPVGLPAAGALVSGTDRIDLPLCAGNPWLLAVSMPDDADPLEQLAPLIPLVAGYPAPIVPAMLTQGRGLDITLRFAPADPHTVPLLSALASLRDQVRQAER